MPAVIPQQDNGKITVESAQATIEIYGDYMLVSYESEEDAETGEEAYEEGEFESEEASAINPDKFIDNIQVVSIVKRPTIFLRYNADIDFSQSFESAQPEEAEEAEEEEEPTLSNTGFTAEEIEEIAEGSLGADSPFASQTANAKIAEIISGPQISQVRSFEILQPWQTVGSKYLGSPFLNEDTFYQYAEVETPDTDEFIQSFESYVNIDAAESYASLQVEIDQDSASPVLEMDVVSSQLEDMSTQFANNSLHENKIDSISLVQVQEIISMNFGSDLLF